MLAKICSNLPCLYTIKWFIHFPKFSCGFLFHKCHKFMISCAQKIWSLGDFAPVCDPILLQVYIKTCAWMVNFQYMLLCTFETMKHVSCVLNGLKSGRKATFQKRKRFYAARICYFCNSNLFLRYSSDRARSILANVIKCIEYLMNTTPPPFVGVC